MKQPDFIIPVYTSDEFSWKNGHGITDASDLIGPLSTSARWAGSRVWNDSFDIGFYVVSCRTGVKMLFTYVHDDDCYDGEYQVYANDADHRITIMND